jgi:hypothetical protein
MPGNGTSVSGGGGDTGSGYRIGDQYVLTAGHVVYEWNRLFPPAFDINSLNVVVDFRNYLANYGSILAGFQSTWPIFTTDGDHVLTNKEIDGHPLIARNDSVLLKSGSGNIGPNDDGLVLFLDKNDLLSTNSNNYFGSSGRIPGTQY